MLLRYCEVIIFKIIVQLPIVSFGLEAFLTKFSWVGFFTHRKTIRNCNFTLRYICLQPTRRILGKKVRGGGGRGDPAFSLLLCENPASHTNEKDSENDRNHFWTTSLSISYPGFPSFTPLGIGAREWWEVERPWERGCFQEFFCAHLHLINIFW